MQFKKILKLLAACFLLSVSSGIIGAGFSLAISFVTNLRFENGWLILLLPLISVIIVFGYKKLGIQGIGTNAVLESADSDKPLSTKLPLGVFTATVLSHLFGASVGREGAALQIGGGTATFFAKKFGLSGEKTKILLRAGMSAVFAAVFGTPIAAFFFALEIVEVGRIHLKSAIPCLLASVTGYFTALLFGAHPERFKLSVVPELSFDTFWKIAVLTVLTAVLSIGFCHSLQFSTRLSKTTIKNPYFRIILGGIVIVILTIFIGNQDYNGAGINVIENIFENEFKPNSLSFALKLLFTCVSVSAGFKGGEIVPTLFIGGTFGALIASILGLPIAFGTALGMVLLFCGVTNCPLASIALGFEVFSGVGFWYFVPTVAICFILSGKISLYSAQKHRFKLL